MIHDRKELAPVPEKESFGACRGHLALRPVPEADHAILPSDREQRPSGGERNRSHGQVRIPVKRMYLLARRCQLRVHRSLLRDGGHHLPISRKRERIDGGIMLGKDCLCLIMRRFPDDDRWSAALETT
ncbi:hypothetical protein EPA93_48110 [Ktedonosporobacter rubrisoli]|uniref:Uncharacterized protein n=1 Tax=Ktedonosporobacter rubrisoli TaxID=2509675 RepID=A0A4P6K4Y3_KTERU|nr:hypothetical protein [Ktedonosporobacter rubrisoli]QBD83319.1 hypothetical protein EPA93_48110 [Ktedonosporobacter rubrisoli]